MVEPFFMTVTFTRGGIKSKEKLRKVIAVFFLVY